MVPRFDFPYVLRKFRTNFASLSLRCRVFSFDMEFCINSEKEKMSQVQSGNRLCDFSTAIKTIF